MKKIKFRLHPAGAIALAAAFLLMDSHLVLASVFALAIHESAHLIVMRCCGICGCSIELTPFGGMADVRNYDLYKSWKRAISALAGILASAAFAWLCWKLAPRNTFWYSFFQANLSLALLNALPAWPLDGARVLGALAGCIGCENGIKKIMRCFTWVIGVGLVAIGLYGAWCGFINPSLLLIGPYLCYAARVESISEKVRKIENAGNKLTHRSFVPVSIWAAAPDQTEEHFGALLGRTQPGRYQMLVQIDQTNGRILKCWTENEMIHHLFANGRN